MRELRSWWFILLLVGLLLTGCGSAEALVRDGQTGNDLREDFPPGALVGQTMVARMDGLQGIWMYISDAPVGSSLTLRLYRSPKREELLRTAVALYEQPGWLHFEFAPLFSDGQDFYFDFNLEPAGELQLGTAPGSSYLDGASYLNLSPRDSQLAFRLSYRPLWAAWGLFRLALLWMAVLATALFLFAIPGWVLGSLAVSSWKILSFIERLALSAGIGLALYPVLFLLLRQAGLTTGITTAWWPGIFSLAWLSFCWLRRRRNRRIAQPQPSLDETSSPASDRQGAGIWYTLLLVVLLALLVFTRFWAVRTVDVPLFGDSLSHTLITRLFLDQGAVPQNWLPFEPYGTFTVQWGFSLIAALLSWVLGLSDLQAVIFAGQLANILAVLSLLPLAQRLAGEGPRRVWAGLGVLLAAGFLMIYPAQYTNWGRYAQLSGQAILPIALWLVWDLIERDEERPAWGQAALLGLVTAGMALHYYRMAFFFGSFALAIGLVIWLPQYGRSWRAWRNLLASALVVSALTLILFLPWYQQMQGAYLAETASAGPVTGQTAVYVLSDYSAWKSVYFYYPNWQVNLGLISLVWVVWRRRWSALFIVLGLAILVAVPILSLVGLPAANFMSNFAVVIFLYAPMSLLIAQLFADVLQLAARWRAGFFFSNIVILGILIWSARGMAHIVRPSDYALAVRPDLHAAAWINANLPDDGRRFLTEAYWYRTFSSIVGADGGWWLSTLTGRQSTVPVQYPLLNDRPLEEDYNERIYALTHALLAGQPGDESVRQALCALDVGYAYIGQHKGPGPGFEGDPLLFTAEELVQSGWFSRVYARDRVQIFELVEGVCP